MTQTQPAKSEATKQTPVQPTPPPAYSTKDGNYNRESGKKTLVFVGIIITIIVLLTVLSLVMMSRSSKVMIKSETYNKQTH